jgi:type VI secretion system protein ImpA
VLVSIGQEKSAQASEVPVAWEIFRASRKVVAKDSTNPMTSSLELAALSAPISAPHPSGVDLEDGPVLGRFNGFRIFGRLTPWDQTEQQPDWPGIRSESLSVLATSKDLRILAHFAAASLRSDGLAPFCGIMSIVADWLEQYWESIYPGLDDDALFRRNALSCFSDRIAIVDALRRVPLVISRQYGSFSLRDLDLSQGKLPAETDSAIPNEAEIAAAFKAMAVEDLNALLATVASAGQSIKRIEVKMTEAVGTEGAPDFRLLDENMSRIDKVLRERRAAHPAAPAQNTEVVTAAPEDASATRGGGNLGAVRSRQDAVRVLDAVAKFFYENEPSSPIPMFIERAKRLVAKSFLEVLEDVAPDAVPQARQAGGVRE